MSDELSPMPARRGRAASRNPANRFEPIEHVEDPAALDEEELRQVPTTFYKDTTRSILAKNDSPDIPFTYSINPYRGCEHGCAYCLSGDTAILMADGTTRPLSELKVGDQIYGTKREGWYRRFTKTQVLDHWKTVREAYRVTLANGTTLVASSDHRFLTERGWKFVTGAQQGASRRPHLTTNNKLMGIGALPAVSDPSPNYKQGYLSGVIRGDGHLAAYSYERAGRAHGNQYHFRLALTDQEPLQRAQSYLLDSSIGTRSFVFQEETDETKAVYGIRTHARSSFERIRKTIKPPCAPSNDWYRGFLSGIFDAEGSYSDGALRLYNSDQKVLQDIRRGLTHLGFAYVADVVRKPANVPVHCIRLLGGLCEHLRFFQLVDNATLRKRSIADHALKTDADLNVVGVEPLGHEMPMYDITTGTGDFIANGVVSHNCYARPSHEYLGWSAGLDFETKILVKENAPRLLSEAFQKPSWESQIVILSGNTDPYQPAERRFELSRQCLEVFLKHRNPVGIITKNALITRDIDILKELTALDLVHVTVSVTSLRNEIINEMEPRTSRPAARLKAIEKLAEAGVSVGVNAAPIVPGLTDEELPAILKAAAERGATTAGYIPVRLPGAVQEVFTEWLERTFPHRKDKVLSRIASMRGGRLNDARFGKRMRGEGLWAETLEQLFTKTCRKLGLNRAYFPLSTEHFRRLPHGQMELF